MHFSNHTPDSANLVYNSEMVRTNIDLDEGLLREAHKLSGLKTKREVVNNALAAYVRYEKRKGILRFYGSGIWQGDLKAMRRNRVGYWWTAPCGSISSVLRPDPAARN
jgi:Arc/MetJ family transcription regulator